jgi:hypothetical protein
MKPRDIGDRCRFARDGTAAVIFRIEDSLWTISLDTCWFWLRYSGLQV